MTRTVSCKVFDQAVQLFVYGELANDLKPQVPVFVVPVAAVKSRSIVLVGANLFVPHLSENRSKIYHTYQ